MERNLLPFDKLHIDVDIICKAMGYINRQPDEKLILRVNLLLKEASLVTEPSYYFEIREDLEVANDSIIINGSIYYTHKIIADLLKGTLRIIPFVATSGKGFQYWMDGLKRKGDDLDIFIADTIGNCIVERAGDILESHLEHILGKSSHSNRLSPGYCGWNIEEQQKLFDLFPKNICDITLSEDSLMWPIKSISGVIGFGEHVKDKVYICDICQIKGCIKNKLKKNKNRFAV